MASRTADLPIYKVTFDLLSLAVDLTANMPRDFKASFGRKLHDCCVDLVMLIARANAARNKVPHLEQLLEQVGVVELLLRLSCDKRLISKPQYARAIALTDQVGKQANGWRKHSASTPAA
jgi:hypothetical protein